MLCWACGGGGYGYGGGIRVDSDSDRAISGKVPCCKSAAPAIERTWTARECRIRDLVVRAVRGKGTALLVREIKVGNFALQVLVVLGASHHTDFGSLSVLVLKLTCPRKNKANNRGTATATATTSRPRNAVTARHFYKLNGHGFYLTQKVSWNLKSAFCIGSRIFKPCFCKSTL
jgi:hypothetical protein